MLRPTNPFGRVAFGDFLPSQDGPSPFRDMLQSIPNFRDQLQRYLEHETSRGRFGPSLPLDAHRPLPGDQINPDNWLNQRQEGETVVDPDFWRWPGEVTPKDRSSPDNWHRSAMVRPSPAVPEGGQFQDGPASPGTSSKESWFDSLGRWLSFGQNAGRGAGRFGSGFPDLPREAFKPRNDKGLVQPPAPNIFSEDMLRWWQPPAALKKSPKAETPISGETMSNATPVSLGPEDQVVDKIIGAESGGKRYAKNPNSSALGIGQYIKTTWEDRIRRYPDLNLTPDGRTDPTQVRSVMERDAKRYAENLRRAGVPVTPGGLYLNHFLGEGGAQSVLSMPDGQPLAYALPDEVLKANPFLRKMSVGDLKQWAERKMSGKGPRQEKAAPPRDVRPGPAGAAHDYSIPTFPKNETPEETSEPAQKRSREPAAEAQLQQEQQTTPSEQPDPNAAFAPYLQQIAQRREVYRQRSAQRRSRVEELLQLGESRNQRRA